MTVLKRSKSKSEIQSQPQQQAQEQTNGGQQAYYFGLKTIQFKDRLLPIVLQNRNGPCPLIAVVNILTLRGYTFPYDKPYISPSDLLHHVHQYIVHQPNNETNEEMRRNYERSRAEAIEVLPTSFSGLFVNVKFSGITSFEFTKEMALFDFCRIRIVHGWLPDPVDSEMYNFLHNLSYNQLIDKQLILQDKLNNEQTTTTTTKRIQSMSPNSCTRYRKEQDHLSSITHEGLLAERFLNEEATQISYYGLSCLHSGLHEEELCVMFRNNHFSTLYKHNGLLLDLVTDLGFASVDRGDVVWENFSDIDGNTTFLKSDFTKYQPSDPLTFPLSSSEQDQALAMQLQHEENKRGKKMVKKQPHNKPPPSSNSEKKHHIFRRYKNQTKDNMHTSQQPAGLENTAHNSVAVDHHNHLSDEKCSIQ